MGSSTSRNKVYVDTTETEKSVTAKKSSKPPSSGESNNVQLSVRSRDRESENSHRENESLASGTSGGTQQEMVYIAGTTILVPKPAATKTKRKKDTLRESISSYFSGQVPIIEDEPQVEIKKVNSFEQKYDNVQKDAEGNKFYWSAWKDVSWNTGRSFSLHSGKILRQTLSGTNHEVHQPKRQPKQKKAPPPAVNKVWKLDVNGNRIAE